MFDRGLGEPPDLLEVADRQGRACTTPLVLALAHGMLAQGALGLDNVSSVLEVGGGFGMQCEVLLRAHPNIRKYHLVDIPPVAYISTQYLKAAFPGQVMDYTMTRGLDRIEAPEPYRIVVLAAWQLPRLQARAELGWSSAALQEMSEAAVVNYVEQFYAHQITRVFVFGVEGGVPGTLPLSRLEEAFSQRYRAHHLGGVEESPAYQVLKTAHPTCGHRWFSLLQ